MNFEIFTKIDGSEYGEVLLFALSTCVWCRKTKEYLDNKGVAYSFVYVDLLDATDKKKVREFVKKWNADISYPTIIINQERFLVGFDEEEIDAELQL